MAVEILLVDYHDAERSRQLVDLLDNYARDPMGGGEPLPSTTRDVLVSRLAAIDGAFSLLACVNEDPAGFCNCLPGFSTFNAQPLINIHDLAVEARYRGQGISSALLREVEHQGRQRGCCKITLEVLSGNTPARLAYRRFGFEPYKLDTKTGSAEFWHKYIQGHY